EALDCVLGGVLHVRDDALVDAAFGDTVELLCVDSLDGKCLLRRARDDLIDAPDVASGARAHAQPRDALRLQRLQHRVDAVDDHTAAAANARARSGALGTSASPASGGSAAPRSIAGTARSSSGPPLSPVSATRIGWKSAFPFWPVFSFTRLAAARNE